MDSCSQKSNQNEEHRSENSIDRDIMKNVTEGVTDINLSVDQFRREFRESSNLNHSICDSISIELNNTPRDTCCDKIEKGRPVQETKKCGMEMEMEEVNQEDDKATNVDLSLCLSPPGGVNPISEDHDQDSSNKSHISTPSSQLSSMSLDMSTINQDLESSNQNEPSDADADEDEEADLPSLVLMGCTHCHIYVMVSEVEPKCPTCTASALLDVFRERPAKR